MSNKPSPYSRLDDDHHNDIDDDIDIDFSTNNNINNNNNNEAEHQYSHDEDDEIEQQELNNNIQYNNDNYDIKRTYDDAYEEDYKEQERQEHQQHSQQSQHTQEMTPMFPITMPSTPNTVNLQDLKGDEGEDAWVAASTTNNPSPALAFSPASASATSRLKRFATRFSMSTNKDKVRLKSKSRSKPKLVRNLTQAAIFSSNEDDSNVEMSTALRRRLRDFRFAQSERKDKYGEVNPWGIFGLYDHLTGIRTDIEWAEDAAYRRENDQPYIRWEDFDQTKDTGMNQPFFTYFTMFVCTVCLVVSIGLNGWKVQPISENPMIGPSAEVLIQMGARDTPLIVEENEWYRIFTAMFLHAGVIHFVMNMFALYFVGYAIEQSHGFFAAALLFILPGIGGNLLSTIFLPEYISVGASGGIFGLIGACLADIISNWGLLFSKHINKNNKGNLGRHIKVLIWLILDIILNAVVGLTPFVDNFTHMGGMLFGFCCGLSTMKRISTEFFGVEENWMRKLQIFLVKFFGIIFTCLCIIGAFTTLISMKDGEMFKCRRCRYVSCAPFPFWTEDKWWYCDDCSKPVAMATQDKTLGVYTHLNLTCPDKSFVTNITLPENTVDLTDVQKKLPEYCREECENVFSY